MPPTVSGTVTDKSGNTASWSTSWTTITPETGMPPLIGSSSQPQDWGTRKDMLEATGGHLEARRIFFDNLADDPRPLLSECVAENLVPVISYKPDPYNWAQMVAGQGDAAITTAVNRIKQTLGTRPCYMTLHHEPSKQSLGRTVGEGGDGADFGRMLSRINDLAKGIYPQLKFGPILNGWWFSAQARGFTDAQIEYWLPAATRAKFDFIAADHYSEDGESETAVSRAQRHVAYLKRVNFAGAMGIGETNAWQAANLRNMFAYAKTEPKFANGFVLLWNSTGGAYLPVHETGLLDDFQDILADWRV